MSFGFEGLAGSSPMSFGVTESANFFRAWVPFFPTTSAIAARVPYA